MMNDEDKRALKILEELSGCPKGASVHDMVHTIVFENPPMSMEAAYEMTQDYIYKYDMPDDWRGRS